MMVLPHIAPVSDMRLRQSEIIARAQEGPVVLVERGSRPTLVVVSPDQWNAIAERMEQLEDAVAVYKKSGNWRRARMRWLS